MGALNTFFSWRGAHHGKVTRRAVGEQTDFMRDAERARWRAERPGQPYPMALMTISEQNAAMLGGQGTPMTPGMWWTLFVLTVLCACTGVGLVLAVPMGVVLFARSPWRSQSQASAAMLDAPTVRLPVVRR